MPDQLLVNEDLGKWMNDYQDEIGGMENGCKDTFVTAMGKLLR